MAGLLLVGAAAPGSSGRFLRDVYAGQTYRLYVPGTGPPASAAPPLVVALHGCWQTPEDFAVGTRLNEAAERRGLLVLYPAQTRTANANRCWNWLEPASRERGVIAGHHVDRERVVALGFSAGGFMAVNLACLVPHVVRGVAVMSGGAYRCGLGPVGALDCMRGHQPNGERAAQACRSAMAPAPRPARATLWHGAEDPVVSPVNIEALARMFARLHGAAPDPAERIAGAVHTVYRDAGGRAPLETWLVAGMGHAWSGGDARGTHTFPPGPSATTRMLDFLLP